MASILLVEDDLPLGNSLQRVLTVAGHHVVWLRTSADARRFLQEQTFALVLLDIGLPDETGLDLLAWLRGQGQATPVMLLTARDSVGERVLGLPAEPRVDKDVSFTDAQRLARGGRENLIQLGAEFFHFLRLNVDVRGGTDEATGDERLVDEDARMRVE